MTRPTRCPTCRRPYRAETRTYADRAPTLRIAARARRRGLTVPEYRAEVAAGRIADPDLTPATPAP